MLFTIRRPFSRRFVEIRFSNIFSHGGGIADFVKNVFLFLRFLIFYFVLKVKRLVLFVGFTFFFFTQKVRSFKFYLVTKMIWSRGKLGRPIANFFIMSLALSIFFISEIFSGSNLVISKELDSDYLKTTIDIIPEKNIALTTLPENRTRTEYIVYKIEPGDTLYAIGNKFKVSIDALRYVNNLYDGSLLKVGEEILIPPSSGLIHKVSPGDTITSIAKKYSVPAQAIADFNYLLEPNKLAVGMELIIPDAKIPQVSASLPITSALKRVGGQEDPNPKKDWCIWPTSAKTITQNFSWYHNGLDIGSSWGAPMPVIYACAPGVVTRAGWDPFGLGLHIRIDHGNGYETVYGHLSRLDVAYGDKVKKGQVIGIMGSTGRSTGPHIHFMVIYKGSPQDPLKYIL